MLGALAGFAAPVQVELVEDVRVVEGAARYPGAVRLVDVELDWNKVDLNQVSERGRVLLTCVSPGIVELAGVDDLVPHGEGEVGEVLLDGLGVRRVDVDRRLAVAGAVVVAQALPVGTIWNGRKYVIILHFV